MDKLVTQLFPLPPQDLELEGLYLGHNLREISATTRRPFIYSNYVTSLDGRIAVPHPSGEGLTVPKSIANPRDWRLFQELAVQADVLITSGRYLRDYAEGRAQEILTVYEEPRFQDLKEWRLDNGLKAYPDMLVISASLDFDIPEPLAQNDRQVLIFTTESASQSRKDELERQLGQVYEAGGGRVQGDQLVVKVAELGYQTIYNATGPRVLHLLLEAKVLNRLYLTLAGRILAGKPYSTLAEGSLLDHPYDLRLANLYLDPHAPDGVGQLFATYDYAQ